MFDKPTNYYSIIQGVKNYEIIKRICIDKEKIFGELKFTAAPDVFLQNEEGPPSPQFKKIAMI